MTDHPSASSHSGKPLLDCLKGQPTDRPPVWLMRQAGRYLPEYRKIRERVSGFLELCYTPELAVEVTLQPLRRFGFDGAILFSDILVVPHALGQSVDFKLGEGPVLDALAGGEDLARLSLSEFHERLSPVYETLSVLQDKIPPETTLIGFAGAPWTVATYMTEGGSSKDFSVAKAWAYGREADFQHLIDLLVEATAAYLIRQIAAGAQAVQLFDSWAGVLPESAFERWVIRPIREITRRVNTACPGVPVIGFPRGAGLFYERFVTDTGVQAVGLDTMTPRGWAARRLQSRLPVQGNLDPIHLLVGGDVMNREVDDIIENFSGNPFVFNLGHGILPATPPEHVAALVDRIRAG